MWQRVEKDCERETPRAPSVRLLFRDERATPPFLEFLEDTRVGKMPGLALFGVQEEELELGEIVLWSEDEEGPGSENDLAHPRMYFFSVFSFLCLTLCFFRGCRAEGGEAPL